MPLNTLAAAAPAGTVLDTEFGDGARFLAVWRQWHDAPSRGQVLHYVGLLPTGKLLRPQTTDAQGQELAHAVADLDGREGFHRLLLGGGHVSLTLCFGDARTALVQQSLQADIVYLNATSPDAPGLAAVAKCCKRGTRLQLTNAPAETDADEGQTLASLGFRALALGDWVFDPAWPVQRSRQAPRHVWTQPQRCTVIGAGISGAAIARVLAMRGWQVQVLDAQIGPAQGASGLPAGLVSPVRSADDGPVSQLTRTGCALTRQHAQALLAQGQDWEPSGAWLRRPAATEAQDAPPALWLPEALWLKPAALVQAWLATAGVAFTGNARVHRLERQGEDWVCLNEAGQELSRSPLLVIASALDAARLLAPANGATDRADASGTADATPIASASTPATAAPDLLRHRRPETTPALAQALAGLHPMYGGVSIGPCAGLADLPSKPVQGRGNFLPSVPLSQAMGQGLESGQGSGVGQSDDQRPFWLAGASFDPNPDTDAQALHQANRERLAQHLPKVAAALAPQFDAAQVQLWRGQRCVSHDRLPLVGAVQAAPDASLWISAAMGARGLSLAALCAELLAARIHGEPLPVPARLAKLLDAQRLQRQRA